MYIVTYPINIAGVYGISKINKTYSETKEILQYMNKPHQTT